LPVRWYLTISTCEYRVVECYKVRMVQNTCNPRIIGSASIHTILYNTDNTKSNSHTPPYNSDYTPWTPNHVYSKRTVCTFDNNL
jgi:hypothetical protein